MQYRILSIDNVYYPQYKPFLLWNYWKFKDYDTGEMEPKVFKTESGAQTFIQRKRG